MKRSAKTIKNYFSVFKGLNKRYTNWTNKKNLKPSHEGFHGWFVLNIPTWQFGTFRSYKAAVVCVAEVQGISVLLQLFENIEATNCKPKSSKLPFRERKTAAQRAKSYTERERDIIYDSINYLPEKSYWKREALDMYRIMNAFGPRECEIESLELIQQTYNNGSPPTLMLRIKNAKYSNGRAHGEFRHIVLTHYEKADIDFLIQYIEKIKKPLNAAGEEIPFEDYKRDCIKNFSLHTKELFPTRKRRITLYSARHQFCANLKKMGYPTATVAALMGHAADDTHLHHYGKKQFGFRTKYLPIAMKDEVAKVKVKNNKCPYSKNGKNKGVKTSNKNSGKGPAK